MVAHARSYNLVMWMDELAYFAFGMLMIGTKGASPENVSKYLELAKEITFIIIPLCCIFMLSSYDLIGKAYVFAQNTIISKMINVYLR